MMQTPTRYQALQLVEACFATQTDMAEAFGVRQPTISRWMSQSRQMPAEFVLLAEQLTGVPRHFLRPDIYPIDIPPPPCWVGFDPGDDDFSLVRFRARKNGNHLTFLDKSAAHRMAR